jgi:hypothetical protein
MKSNYLLPSLILTFGLGLSGFFIGNGILQSRTFDRYVTVKGLAEKEVNADNAIWPITFTITSNELKDLKNQLDKQSEQLVKFFSDHGIKTKELNLGVPSIIDTKANLYGGNNYNPFRYIGKGRITVQTSNIDAINKAILDITDLLSEGIVIEQDDYRNRVEYQFSKLNEIKPDMINQATKEAREAAQQFAEDSGSEVGGIRKATQGYFSINDRDTNTPYIKKVRVVTTIEYYLN